LAVGRALGPAGAAVVAERARVVAVDEDERPRPLELHDASETLGAKGLHGFAARRQRTSAPTTGVRSETNAAPKRRKVTSTPRLDELGVSPHLIARIFPFFPFFIGRLRIESSPRAGRRASRA